MVFSKAGYVCIMCSFKATTKNKYREMKDHLVRCHFHDQIKAALPTHAPFMCPNQSCDFKGKDWQAVMRHYIGKHGVLDSHLNEYLASKTEFKTNLDFKSCQSSTNNSLHNRHSSGDSLPTSEESQVGSPIFHVDPETYHCSEEMVTSTQQFSNQVLPNGESTKKSANEFKISATLVQYKYQGQEAPIVTVSIEPRGSSKVIVETVQSIPIEVIETTQ